MDLRTIAYCETVRYDLPGSLRRYSDLVPAEKWPTVLCMASDPGTTGKLRDWLLAQGFVILSSSLVEPFGILKLSCPPEISIVREIAGLPETCAIADPHTPVTLPIPMAVSTMMVECRRIVGVTPGMQETFGHDVTLAVLDTGVDRNHPACARIGSSDYRDFTASGEEDVDGHGTHVAAIAAGDDTSLGGRYAGIAPRCRLVAGKVLSPGKAGNLESILQGMAWAVIEKRADILSLSLGEMDTNANGQSIWSRACDEAFRKGTVVCVAAGNPLPSYPESVCVPADSATAVTVGAIDKDCRLAAFSAQGSANPESPLFGKPNCVGPGVDIVAARSSTANFDSSQIVDHLHIRLSGTSMATPAIAGCLALLKSKARSLGWDPPPADLIALFYAACSPLEDPNRFSYSSAMQIGHGLIDMEMAFQEAERRAHQPGRATATAPAAPKEITPPPSSASVPTDAPSPAAAHAAPGTAADVCYRCGKRYLSKVGVFSPAWQCDTCGAPICQICWQLGHRACEKHKGDRAGTASPAAGRPAAAHAADPILRAPRGPIPLNPNSIPMGVSPMTLSDPPGAPAAAKSDPRWAETFANRFDLKMRAIGAVKHPWSGEEFKVDPRLQAQTFRRSFGDVTQFPLSSGLLKKGRLTLAAVALEADAPATNGTLPRPAETIFQQIAGPDGLDFDDEAFYCVGVYSAAGWPEEWKNLAEIRGNAMFFLVEKGEGTRWNVFGPQGALRPLFDPETPGEKKTRAAQALAGHPKLVLPGDQIPMDAFLAEFHLDRQAAEAALQSAGDRFQLLEHKQKFYIQRSIR